MYIEHELDDDLDNDLENDLLDLDFEYVKWKRAKNQEIVVPNPFLFGYGI
jgi:hypothetical protein